ncbi:MAG TPA: uracil phosphoribosyltransferase [Planctomycetota bacterium]|nr:uracil phosphoribosyltransferase [Planctomycetota bacterium]
MPRVLDEERNPVVGRLLATVRSIDLQSDPHRFRDAMRRLGAFLAYEIASELDVGDRVCRTPLGERREPVLAETPVLVTILRASLPLWDGMLEVFPDSPTMVIGAARREGAVLEAGAGLEVDLGYTAFSSTADRTLIYADPMIATGSTLLKIHPRLMHAAGSPRRTFIAGVIGYRATAERLEREIPNCRVVLCSADDELDARGYIVPGLGDAGDLAFGPKLR